MFEPKKNYSKYAYARKITKYNFFYSLDCQSGEGLVNSLLDELRNSSSREFNKYLNFFLKKCININRSFSDAITFLSIWLEKSPQRLLKELQNVTLIDELINELKKDLRNEARINELRKMIGIKKLKKKKQIDKLQQLSLKSFFNRTEYDREGNQWYFPKLLKTFEILIEREKITVGEILDYLFEVFDFFSTPDTFVVNIIGYDRLKACIEECPSIFKQALLLKMKEFIALNRMDIGLRSYRYLKKEVEDMGLILFLKKPYFYSSSPVERYTLSYRSNYFRENSGY